LFGRQECLRVFVIFAIRQLLTYRGGAANRSFGPGMASCTKKTTSLFAVNRVTERHFEACYPSPHCREPVDSLVSKPVNGLIAAL
jgi:hypothetical protein